jgi:hypothetical protein
VTLLSWLAGKSALSGNLKRRAYYSTPSILGVKIALVNCLDDFTQTFFVRRGEPVTYKLDNPVPELLSNVHPLVV